MLAPRALLLVVTFALAACGPQTTADLDDGSSVEGAASLTPLPPAPEPFKLLWHVNTRIDELADAPPVADVRRLNGFVDGYFVVSNPGGVAGYWPGRPWGCALNKKADDEPNRLLVIRGVDAGFSDAYRTWCDAQLEAWLAGRNQSGLQAQALQRALVNIGVTLAEDAGKVVVGHQNVSNGKGPTYVYSGYSADGGVPTDSIAITRVPSGLEALALAGVKPTSAFTYQEPSAGNALDVPLADGTGRCTEALRNSCLPYNSRVLQLLRDAFTTFDLAQPVGAPRTGVRRFNLNVRAWGPDMEQAIVQARSYQAFRGVFFEGGSRLAAPEEAEAFANRVAGLAWMLGQTNREVYVLMPAFWTDADLASDATLDQLPSRVRQYVRTLDEAVAAAMRLSPGRKPLCSARVHLIPGAYGNPVHPSTFPVFRAEGVLAGTVGGVLATLNTLRESYCR